MIRKVFSFENTNFPTGQDKALVLSFFHNGFKIIAFSHSSRLIGSIDEYVIDPVQLHQLQSDQISNNFKEFIVSAYGITPNAVISQAEVFTLIPEELYLPESKDQLFEYVAKNNLLNMQACSKEVNIGSDKLRLLYTCLNWQQNLFTENNAIQLCDIEMFVNAILINPAFHEGTFVNVSSDYYDILILKNKKLSLINRFRFSGSGEFCYYLFGSMKAAGMDPANATIHMAGEIMPESEIIRILKRYVSDIQYLLPTGFEKSEYQHLHRYFNQLSVAL